jgi:cell division protein FtsI/penicillin-binding protein 2
VIQGPSYAEKAKHNIIAYLYEPASRGIIYDRHGVSLTQNEQRWDLYFHQGQKKQLVQVIKDLSFFVDDHLLHSALLRFQQQPSFEPLLLLKNLSDKRYDF